MKSSRLHRSTLLLTIASLLSLAPAARAESLIDERFEKPELDKAWVVTKEKLGSKGVAAFAIKDGKLNVSKLTYVEADPSGDIYPTLALSRKLPKPIAGDFDSQLTVGWSSKGAPNEFDPIQYIRLRLLDDEGKEIVAAGYYDGHIGGPGRREARIGAAVKTDELPTQPFEGEGVVSVRRRGEKVVVFWNDLELSSGSSAKAVVKVEIQAQGYWYGTEKRNLFNNVWAGRMSFETP
ncbi:MAG: hypothetical protein NTW19_09635 [Planctomycetota bacterium]|nr:hypothetical protein [Planctomycetota bacterium]